MEPLFNLQNEIKFNKNACFICQKRHRGDAKKTIKPSEKYLSKLKEVTLIRKSLGDKCKILDRIDKCLQNEPLINIKWHSQCYSTFTHKNVIPRLKAKEITENCITEKSNNEASKGATTRSKIPTFDWDNCAFCQEDTKQELRRITEIRLSKYVKENSKFNPRLFIALSTINDCPAADLLYHLTCYRNFQRCIENSVKEQKVDYALPYVLEELKTAALQGDVVLLDDVWIRYQNYANEYNLKSNGSYKDKHTFGICLKNKISDSFEFVNKLNDNETVMFPINHFKEGIASIIQQNKKEIEESIIPKYRPENNDEFLALVHVALSLRGELMAKPGYTGVSVTEDAAVGCIPENLYLFLSLLFSGQDFIDIGENENFESGKW